MNKLLVALISLLAGASLAVGGYAIYHAGTQANGKTQSKEKKGKQRRAESRDVETGQDIKHQSAPEPQAESVADDATKYGTFDQMEQKVQLANLVDYGMGETYLNAPYKMYMGKPKEIIVHNQQGAGALMYHVMRIMDNHDGTFTYSHIETTDGSTGAGADSDNTYWEDDKTVTKDQLTQNYRSRKPTVDKVVPLIDMSASTEVFDKLG